MRRSDLHHVDSDLVSENAVNFKRKRIRGQNGKTKKTWMDDDGNYRVTWSNEIAGIKMETPVIHACVLTDWGWGFAGKRGPYKTIKAAKQACEFNQELWKAFLSMEGRDKVSQYNALRHRSMVGSGKSAVSAMSDVPSWVLGLADERQLSIICPKGKLKGGECDFPEDPTPILKASDSLYSLGQNGENESSTLAPDADIKAARRAKVPVKERRKNSKPPTTKRSRTGKKRAKRSASTTSSSRRSRKKKEKS